MFKTDAIGVNYSTPKFHVINFFYNNRLTHRVFEPILKRHIFIPCKGDWIEIGDKKYEVKSRQIKYLSDRIVASVYLVDIND